MELLPILRALRRGRLLIGAGVVAALLLGFVFGRPTPTSSAVAHTRVALDTPHSQLVADDPAGADTLPWRTSLLTHLMLTESTRNELARRIGVRPYEVAVVDAYLYAPKIAASMPTNAAKAAATTGAPYVLTVSLPKDSLPIISIDTAAPDRAGAVRLAHAAVDVLKAQASLGGSYESLIKTDSADAPRLQRFVVDQVAPVHVKRVAGSQPPMKALGGIAFMLIAWCLGVTLLPRLARRRKIVAAQSVQ
jgi:hypothetical protein